MRAVAGAATGAAAGASAAVDWRQISAPPAATSSTGHTIPSLNQNPHLRSSRSAASASSTIPATTISVSRRPARRSIGASLPSSPPMIAQATA